MSNQYICIKGWKRHNKGMIIQEYEWKKLAPESQSEYFKKIEVEQAQLKPETGPISEPTMYIEPMPVSEENSNEASDQVILTESQPKTYGRKAKDVI